MGGGAAGFSADPSPLCVSTLSPAHRGRAAAAQVEPCATLALRGVHSR